METAMVAALQHVREVRSSTRRWRGLWRSSQAQRGVEGETVAAVLRWRGCGCARRVRERGSRGEIQGRGRERGGPGGSGRRRGDDARRRGGQAMQTSRVVAWRARARAPCPSSAYWREEEGDRGGRRRWAGPAGGAGQLGRLQVSGPGGLLSFIFFCSVLFLFI